ncbi:DUF4249 domain-containing protein [Gaoshiqia sediminis]|uniref:DUF4249 domain-containing protein n=1 Tax=Gaoshiqia sediminis TaxID=2986998 RepID=A0AA41Y6F0_9BACT|nr:DUF4249 domain-containing protein [Gaoshiqia sediminis]MCW0482336.1 DUF4249 domain-containing protein [Gaoshiqia sediminis]
MKRHILKFTIEAVFIFLFFSCEKVIEIDLNISEPKIVIESEISNQPGPYTVRLTETVNFREENAFPTLSKATVRIYDDAGNTETLTETITGFYNANAIQGTPGRTYTLEVTTGENTYKAVSTMPPPVNIDTLTVENTGSFGPAGNGETINVQFTDPTGKNNYYRFVLIINGIEQDGVFIDNDELQDGEIKNLLLTNYSENTKLNTGDYVTVLLQTLDKSTYEYFRTLRQISGSEGGPMEQSTSPANPISNINNGALGYFNTCAVTSKSIIIP